MFERDLGGAGNWGEVKKITASDGMGGDDFGRAVAISGDTLIVGADQKNSTTGAAYVYERHLGGTDSWGEAKKLTASDAAVDQAFGISVAVNGDIAVAGAWNFVGPGAAYVFERDQGGIGNWGETKKLPFPGGSTQDQFGETVAVEGTTVLVGNRHDDDACAAGNGCNSGAVHVFERDEGGPGNWGETQKLVASDTSQSAEFGDALALGGATLLIGAFAEDHTCPAGDFNCNAGAAYLFLRDAAGLWSEADKLVASDATDSDLFGGSVALADGIAVVGAYGDDDACVPAGTNCLSGSAYLFDTTASNSGPTLTIPSNIPAVFDSPVEVPVELTTNGAALSATTFSVDFDESCLAFDPTDADADGVPDDAVFNLPADFTGLVSFAAPDTDGEIDIAIADFSAPLATLPDGTLLTLTFTPLCDPPIGTTIAPVTFSAFPGATFGGDLGQDVPGTSVGGSVEILSGLSGDCNGDGFLSAGDVSACVLEVFDDDGDFFADVPGSTFAGNPVGCDANRDTIVDAGDISCKIRLIFEGPGSCAGSKSRSVRGRGKPSLRLVRASWENDGLQVPVRFRDPEARVNSLIFSLDYDERFFVFDPADGDRDGIPDAVTLDLPDHLVAEVSFDPSDRDGEIDVLVLDPVRALAESVDGPLLTVTLKRRGESLGGMAPVRFSRRPGVSFGSLDGMSVEGKVLEARMSLK